MSLFKPQQHSGKATREIEMREIFGLLALLIVPVGLMVLVMAVKYQGLQSPVAWEHAQLARNIAAGKGIVTDVVRPFSLSIATKFPKQPDLYNELGHPLSLAVFFRFFESSDRIVALVGMGFWVLTIWLTFLIAYRWFGGAVASLATLFYICNISAIAGAVSGLPLPLVTVFILSACWAAVPSRQLREPVAGQQSESVILPGWRLLLAGAACGLATLTEFTLVIFVVAMSWYVMVTQQNRWRSLGLVIAGWLLVLAPWGLRNLTSSHFNSFGLHWYGLLVNTKSFPGESIWRLVTPPPGPLLHSLRHLHEMVNKLFISSTQFIQGAPGMLHPVVALTALAALPGLLRNPRQRGVAMLIVAGLALTAGISCFLQPDPQLLVIWSPLLAILAAVRIQDWITQKVGPLSWHWLILKSAPAKTEKADANTSRLTKIFQSRTLGRAATYLLLIAVTVPPLFGFLKRSGGTTESNPKKQFEFLRSQLTNNTVIWTDQPAFVAWYAERPALWLPQSETDLDRVEAKTGHPAAIYIASPAGRDGTTGDWWSWVSTPHGIYRGLAPVPVAPGGGVLRLRPKDPAAIQSTELVRLVAETGNNPNSSDAHYRLATEYYRLDRLREAVIEFRAAGQLDPQNTQALLGLWQTTSRLNDAAGTFKLAERVVDLDARAPAVVPALEEAAKFFEQAAGRGRDPWLLLDAALCYAKLKQWDQAEACCRRVAATAPKELPVRLLIGDLYLQKGLPEQALTEFRQLIEEQPLNAVAREALGLALREAGKLPEAQECFEKAAKLRPDWPLPYFMAGNVRLQLKEYAPAADLFAKALELAPHTPRFQYALGTACVLLNDYARTITTYEEILKDNPDDPVALNNLAVAYAKSGQKLDRALTLIRQAAAAFPKNLDIQDSLGLVCNNAGLHDEAIAILQPVTQAAPQNGLAHYHLGKALLAAGRRAEAITELRMALTLELPAIDKAAATALLAKP